MYAQCSLPQDTQTPRTMIAIPYDQVTHRIRRIIRPVLREAIPARRTRLVAVERTRSRNIPSQAVTATRLSPIIPRIFGKLDPQYSSRSDSTFYKSSYLPCRPGADSYPVSRRGCTSGSIGIEWGDREHFGILSSGKIPSKRHCITQRARFAH